MQRTKPTPKQKLYARALIKHKFNGAKAVQEVYDVKPQNAKTLAYQNNQKPVVQKEIRQVLNDAGLSLDYLSSVTKDAIEYNKDGKPSQAVLADLVKHSYKLHNALPSNTKMSIKQEYKVLLDKDYNTIRQELIETNTRTQELLNDLSEEANR